MTDDDEWADPATGWDDDPAVRAYATAAYESLLMVLARHGIELDGARVCDFGCGTGLLTERLVAAGATVDAVDTSVAMLDVLREKIVSRPLVGVSALSEIPAPATLYEVIACSSVCSFLPDYPGTVADLVTRLRPGGVFVQWDWERHAEEPDGLTRQEVEAALTTSGLTEVVVATAFEAEVEGHVMRPLVGHGRRPAD